MTDPGDAGRSAGEEIGRVARQAMEAMAPTLERLGLAATEALERLGFRHAGTELLPGVQREIPLPEPVAVGEEAELRVRLNNASAAAVGPFSLTASDLRSAGGDTIPASAVVAAEHQRVVAGHSSDTAPLTVRVPADAKPGTYTGTLTGGPEETQLSLEVT